MAGLFSMPTPEEVRSNARRGLFQQAAQSAQAPRGRGAVQAATQAGGLFGEALGRAAGGQAPGEAAAQQQQAVQQQVAQQVQEQGLDLTQPQDFIKMTEITANAFNAIGDVASAQQAAAQGLEVRKQFAGKGSEKFESILDENGNVIAQKNINTGRVFEDPRAAKDPDTQINNILGDQDELAKSLSKNFGRDIVEQRTKAVTARDSLIQSNAAVDLLNSDEVVTGTGANFVVGVGKALKRLGFDNFEDNVQNTEAFMANMGNATLAILGSGALGAGTGISDNDRKFAKQIAGGEITLDEGSIRRIIKLNQKVSMNTLKRFNTTVGSIPEKSKPFPLEVEIPEVQSPIKRKPVQKDGFKIRRKK